MNWRRFPLPLLLLTVTLSPAEIAQAGPRAATSISPAPPHAAAVAQTPISSQRRRRESEGEGEPTEITAQTVRLVSGYLQNRSSGTQSSLEQERAWKMFHRSCDATIRRFAAARGLRSANLDDCAQEVWLDLLGKLPDFELDQRKGRFESWLYRVVQNKSADIQRRQRRRDAVVQPLPGGATIQSGDDPAAACERAETRDAVRLGLSRLKEDSPRKSYRVLELRQVEGQRVDEVAKALDLTPAQVWARECRMKQKLRSMLANVA